jgi:hypothetical protein
MIFEVMVSFSAEEVKSSASPFAVPEGTSDFRETTRTFSVGYDESSVRTFAS